jgi:hypothetical protein
MADHVPPTILTLLLCEKHLQDARTGQHSLISVIHTVHAASFPVLVPPPALFCEFTGCHGPLLLVLRIVDAEETREPVCQININGHLPDPLAVGSLVFGLPPLIFPEPGDYRIQAVCSGIAVLEKRLIVRKVSPPTAPAVE